MGSSVPNDEGLPPEMDMGDEMGGVEPENDKPFDDEPFDAEIEANEDENPEKYIQQLAGKLGQSLRTYTDGLGEPDFDLEKFAINSVLSATNSSKMDQEDQSDIIAKVKSSETNKGGDNDADNGGDNDAGDDALNDDGEELDLSGIDMEETHNPNLNRKTVFQDSTLNVKDGGMEENKYLTNEHKDMMLVRELRRAINEYATPEPAVKPKPQVKPIIKPKRKKIWEIKPEGLPNPNPKAEKKNLVDIVEVSDFSQDGDSVSIEFRFNGNKIRATNFENTGKIVSKRTNTDEPTIFIYQSDVIDTGNDYDRYKQFITKVEKYGEPNNYDWPPKFTNDSAPEIEVI